MSADVGAGEERKARVFLSYSRKDKDFTRKLARALTGLGYVADFDQSEHDPANIETGISAEDDWWSRLQDMIAAAEAMVLIVSPHSAASPVCGEEIAYARVLGKRVIPVLLNPIDFDKAPPRLAALNVKLSFTASAAFNASLAELSAVLDVDVAWHREGARLSALAVTWDGEGQPEARLLATGAVNEAEAWAARRPANAPPPGEPLTSFLAACRAKAVADRERLLTITGRAFVKPAEQALAEGHYDAALRLAAAGALLGEDFDMRLVPERVRSAHLAAEAQPLRLQLIGHEQAVTCALFSPDGTRVVTASVDHTARLWDAFSGEGIAVMRGHEGSIDAIAYSPDGTRIVTASSDQTSRIWDAMTGGSIAVLRGHDDDVCDARFSPDGMRVVTASGDKTARVWDASTGHQIAVLRGHGKHVVREEPANWAVVADSVLTADFDPTGTRVLTSSLDGTARIWDAASGRELFVLRGHNDVVEGASYSPDGARIVTMCQDRTARLWDARSGGEIAVLSEHEHGVTGAAFSPNSKFVVTASENARLWEAASGRELAVMRSNGLSNVVFSPDGNRIAAHGERQVHVWDAAAAKVLFSLRGHGDIIRSVAFSPDGRSLLTSSTDCTARVWDSASGREIAVLRGNNPGWSIRSAKFSPNGSRIVTACSDETACIWDAETGRVIATLRGVRSAAFNPDGTRVLTACKDNTARLWNADTGREVGNLKCDQSVWNIAAFSPDGDQIATTGLEDSSVRVWDARNGHAIAAMLGHDGSVMDVSFSPNGSRIVTGSRDCTARIWDAKTGQEITILRGHAGAVTSAAFGPNETSIVTGSGDASIRIWDASGREMAALLGHEYWVDSVCFSQDGTRIVSASSIDRTARIWDVASRTEALILPHEEGVNSAHFSSDGLRVLTAATDGAVRIWDVSRTVAITGDPIETLAASLSNGRGEKNASERDDLIMRAAPDDLYEATMARLSPRQRESVAIRAENLARPLHPNCYLPPSVRPSHQPQALTVNTAPTPEAVIPLAASPSAEHGSRMSGSAFRGLRFQRVLFLLLLGATAAGAIGLWLQYGGNVQ